MAKVNKNRSRKRQKTPEKSISRRVKADSKINFKSKNRKCKHKDKTSRMKQRTEMPSFLSECQIVSETTLINISDDEDDTVNGSQMVTVINNAEKSLKEKEVAGGDGDDSLIIITPDESTLRNDSAGSRSAGKSFEISEYIPLELDNDDTVIQKDKGKSLEISDYIPLEMENEETVIQKEKDDLNDVVYISDSEDSIPTKRRRANLWQHSLSDGEISNDSVTIIDDTVIENKKEKSASPNQSRKEKSSYTKRRRRREVEIKDIALSPIPSTSRNRSILSESNTRNKKTPPAIDTSAMEKLSELYKVLSNNPNLPEVLKQLGKAGRNNEEANIINESDYISSDRTYCSSGQFISDNIYHVEKIKRRGLRPIVIDGSNVAMQHTNGRIFSVKGLKICIDYFRVRGHKVYAFVPSYRMKRSQSSDQQLMNELVKRQLVFLTSSREVLGHKICSYDDRILVQVAAALDAVIVSNDNYRDLIMEDRRLIPVIRNNILSPTWVGDMIVFPDDPLGRNGPKLKNFLCY